MTNLYIDMDGVLAKWKTSSDEELHREGYFLGRPAEEKLIAAIKDLMNKEDVEVNILSSFLVTSKYAFTEKHKWLDKYLPEIKRDNRHFIPCGMSKAAYLEKQLGRKLTETDILIDDYSVNLHTFKAAGGRAIKFLNGINGKKGTWKNETCTADTFGYKF